MPRLALARTTPGLAAACGLACLTISACAQPEHAKPEPLGYMPTRGDLGAARVDPLRDPRRQAARGRPARDATSKAFASSPSRRARTPRRTGRPTGGSSSSSRRATAVACDQMFVIDLGSGVDPARLQRREASRPAASSTIPKGERILFSQTAGAACPPKPDRSQGYVWPLDEFDIYAAKPDGSDRRPLITGQGYDAEATAALRRLAHRVHQHARRRPRALHGEARRERHPAHHQHARATTAARSSRPTSRSSCGARAGRLGAGARRVQGAPGQGPGAAHRSSRSWSAGAEGQNARAVTKNGKANFAPSFLPRLAPGDLRLERRRVAVAGGERPNFDLYVVDPDAPPNASGRAAARADHVLRRVRRLSRCSRPTASTWSSPRTG